MANINFEVTTTLYWSGFTGQFQLGGAATVADAVNDYNLISNIIINEGTIASPGASIATFTPVQSEKYPNAITDHTYTTWRSISYPDSQFPEAGVSLDVWSHTLYIDINNGATWQTLIDNGAYALSSTKNTLVYSYDPVYSPRHGTGAGSTIVFTLE